MEQKSKISRTNLERIILESSQFNVEKKIVRKKYFDWLISSSEQDFVKVITGFRRVGKSFLLKQLREYLIQEKNIPEKNIFFINFENDAIDFTDVTGLRQIWELYKTTLNNQKEKIYLFLDEIQNITAWEKFVRTLYDSGKEQYNIFVTGSNSAMLSSEFSTALGGRTIELKIHPFNFKEYLELADFDLKKLSETFWQAKYKDVLNKNLFQYLKYGGLPETIKKDEKYIFLYLKNIFNKVINDDIIVRFKIRKIVIAKKLFSYLFNNVGNIISFTKIVQILKSSNEKTTVPSLIEYAENFSQSFAIQRVAKFDWKKKMIFRHQYKFYAVDNGFLSALNFDYQNIDEKLLENLVFNIYQQKYTEIYYGRNDNGNEIDFIISQGEKKFLKVQVTLELNEKTKKRELGNFALVNKYLQNGKNILITLRGEKRIHNFQGVEIEEIPLLDFLLKN